MMNEIPPTWAIAKQISARHTFVSLSITLPLILTAIIASLLTLKLLGYQDVGILMSQFTSDHSQYFISTLMFIHLVPMNLYAIIRVFRTRFPDFELKIIKNE